MKYAEFISRVEELGFVTVDWGEYVSIHKENKEVAWVRNNVEASMNNARLYGLSTAERMKLFDILVEYARTPIEDRKDEKKYFIYPIRTMERILVRFDHTFNNSGYEYEHSFGIYSTPVPYNKGVSTHFLEDEAREICEFFGWDFDKVTVDVKQ